ncbi:hypothetical protein [Myroides phaeus]|uniref:Uncharacterized protein n=1 Tax=Myroides phaeus TaxID=702745 RepID=A0A1G8DLK3_9FLAO|nr:hypothetical protein [Myroides phaeus]SDH58584.1 hypothetical protein SAMN05421818_10786 [Myroides phaeus]
MKIVRKFLLLCLALIATDGYSQIGINQRGVSKNATAEFNVNNKGVLIPRVNITNKFKSDPIVGEQKDMPDGLVVIDVHDKEESVLSFWNNKLNGEKGAWEQLANFDRLPRTAIIGFQPKNSLTDVNVQEDGVPIHLRSSEIKFNILNDGHLANLQVLEDHNDYGITFGISSGVYLIEFIAIYIADPITIDPLINYNMAYFTDFFVTADHIFKGPAVEGGPQVGEVYWTYYRVERSTYSPVKEEHRVVFSNVFDLETNEEKEVLYRISLGLGRASNTSYRDVFKLSGNNSYLKITKLK